MGSHSVYNHDTCEIKNTIKNIFWKVEYVVTYFAFQNKEDGMG